MAVKVIIGSSLTRELKNSSWRNSVPSEESTFSILLSSTGPALNALVYEFMDNVRLA